MFSHTHNLLVVGRYGSAQSETYFHFGPVFWAHDRGAKSRRPKHEQPENAEWTNERPTKRNQNEHNYT